VGGGIDNYIEVSIRPALGGVITGGGLVVVI